MTAEVIVSRPVPTDLPDPSALLATWAAGLAIGAAVVARWSIVGPGFLWTIAAASLVVGVFSVPLGVVSVLALGAVAAASIAARRPVAASWLFAAGGMGFVVSASSQMRWPLVVTGLLALGGTSSEMLLGHWYLVDPRLPRWSLRTLDGAGIGGLLADLVLVVGLGGLVGAGTLGWVFLGLGAVGVSMMLGVWFSLREKGYEGVMAATGLSYLSVLTTLGSVALGRYLVG